MSILSARMLVEENEVFVWACNGDMSTGWDTLQNDIYLFTKLCMTYKLISIEWLSPLVDRTVSFSWGSELSR